MGSNPAWCAKYLFLAVSSSLRNTLKSPPCVGFFVSTFIYSPLAPQPPQFTASAIDSENAVGHCQQRADLVMVPTHCPSTSIGCS